ncbi:solute carrier organic anion transporter family member 5A1b, partial [Clupea harengus]|uniref:Solute carrier organic anion transporter family member 5A1b n=1 Tax=Clupea harengus TaxID=7950 RepID=A0A8M1KGF6_CLUHA
MMEYVYVLLALLLYSRADAERKIGCLFANDLCEDYEICINDALFGQCQSPPATEVYTYDVTAAEVDRLRTLLQKLSYRGLTWEDETTQQVLWKELSKLNRIPRPETAKARPVAQSVPTGGQSLKPSEAELRRGMQKYLQQLGYLPKTKSDRIQGDAPPGYYPSWKTSSPSFPPDGTADGTVLLMAALQQYLSRSEPLQPDGGKPHGDGSPLPSRPRPVLSQGEGGFGRVQPPPEGGFGRVQSPPEGGAARAAMIDRPKMKSGVPRNPLSAVDGRPRVAVGGMSDLELLAALIAEALPEVEHSRALTEEEEAVLPEDYQEEVPTELPSPEEEEEEEEEVEPSAAPYNTQQPPAE